MKPRLLLLLAFAITLLHSPVRAESETWTRKDGKSAQLKLVGVSGEGDALVGKFKLANGKDYELKVTDLADADAKRLQEAAAFVAEGGSLTPVESVYDSFFKDGLVKLEGGQMKPHSLDENPRKYFVFYHTASWCGPCQEFMPKLKAFDAKHKASKLFQVILVSHDDSSDMKPYAVAKSIEWPHIKHSKISAFNKAFPHPGDSIPNVVITDLQGNIVQCSVQNGKYMGAEYPLFLIDLELNSATKVKGLKFVPAP